MDTSDLKKIFALTAVVSLLVFSISFQVDVQWAARYGVLSVMALLNWMALAVILSGVTKKQPWRQYTAVAVKVVLLGCLCAYGVLFGLELTSFLAALNTFFVCIFIRMLANAVTPRRIHAADSLS